MEDSESYIKTLLNDRKERQLALLSKISDKLLPILFEDHRQLRELTQNIAIIAGAIASFTIQALGSELIKHPWFAYFSLVTLFFTIMYAIQHLGTVITHEINAIANQHTTFAKIISEDIANINKAISNNDVSYILVDTATVEKELDALEEPITKDRSVDVLKFLLGIALTLLLIAFVPFQITLPFFHNINWHALCYSISLVAILGYAVFAPETMFYKTSKNESNALFDRWKNKSLAWNIHQSFIHFLGSLIGFVALDILIFTLGITDPHKYTLVHLVLGVIGFSGVMGFLPRIIFESNIGKS